MEFLTFYFAYDGEMKTEIFFAFTPCLKEKKVHDPRP
jgi:hypothetical protein